MGSEEGPVTQPLLTEAEMEARDAIFPPSEHGITSIPAEGMSLVARILNATSCSPTTKEALSDDEIQAALEAIYRANGIE